MSEPRLSRVRSTPLWRKADERHPPGERLTMDQQQTLPEGARVTITWSGGNGPHRYTVRIYHGVRHADTGRDSHDPRRFATRLDSEWNVVTEGWLDEQLDGIRPNERPPFGVCLLIWGPR